MLFIILIMTYSFIFYIALFGRTEENELKRAKDKYKQITNHNYE